MLFSAWWGASRSREWGLLYICWSFAEPVPVIASMIPRRCSRMGTSSLISGHRLAASFALCTRKREFACRDTEVINRQARRTACIVVPHVMAADSSFAYL